MASIGEIDVRPSWGTTVSIGRQTFADSGALFGTGPGSFYHAWAKYMPNEISITKFWLTDFYYGIGLVPTSIVTTGLIGAIAWFAFFVVFLWRGARGLLSREILQGDITDYLRVTSFVAALYLWINMFIQIPSPVLLIFAALFTGVFVASLGHGTEKEDKFNFKFKENPRVGFLATLILTLVFLGSAGGIYGLTKHYNAEASYQKALVAFVVDGDIDASHELVTEALKSNKVDIYYRLLSNIGAVRAQGLVTNKTPEELESGVEEFKEQVSVSIVNALEATRLDVNDYQNWINLGKVYQSIANLPVGVDGVVGSAVGAYDNALELRPSSPSVYYAKAILERDRGDNEKARELVEKAITLRNQYTEASFLLAQIQIDDNDVENAINSVESITLFNPNNAVAFFQLGLLHYSQEDFVSAVQSFSRAVKINNEYANARYFLGLANWRLGNMKSALEEFKKIQKTNPENSEIMEIIKNLERGQGPFANLEISPDLQSDSELPIKDGVDEAPSGVESGNLAE